MKVREIMKREIRVALPGTDLARVGAMMLEAGCGSVPVIDDADEVIGMITDRDICIAVSRWDERPSQITVREAMSADVYTCRPDDDVQDALRVMRNHRVRRLPVVDVRNRLEGILSIDDVVLFARGGQTLQSEGFRGPFYADVALTLKAICEHPAPTVM